MNLLLAASNTGCNGAIVYTRRLAPLLAARGHRVWLAARPDSWIAAETRGEVPLLPTDFSRWPLGELRRVSDFCRAESIRLVHSHLTRASNFGAMLQLLHGIPSLAHLHANHVQAHAWFHRRVLAVSADTLRRWRRLGVGLGSRGAVLPNFVDPRAFAERPAGDPLRALIGAAPSDPVLVCVGTIDRRKGQDLAAAALPAIRRRHPAARLVLIGGGSLPAGLADQPGLHLLGHRTDVPALLGRATLCVVPSRDEPFGLAAIEAMAAGVPVLASGAGGLGEVVEGGAGALFRSGDAADLARVASDLLADPATLFDLADDGAERVRERYLPEAHLDQLERHYAAVAAQA